VRVGHRTVSKKILVYIEIVKKQPKGLLYYSGAGFAKIGPSGLRRGHCHSTVRTRARQGIGACSRILYIRGLIYMERAYVK
jgi:hypothetical protein